MRNVTIGAPLPLLVAGLAAGFAVQAVARDTTPPVVAAMVTGKQGNNGWYTGNVTLRWSVSDPQSRVTSAQGCRSVTLMTDTAGAVYTCMARSSGGTTTQSVTIKRDATLPAITITRPASGASYSLNQTVTASFACSDPTSGIATCSGSASNGVAIDTASAGKKSFAMISLAKNLMNKEVGFTYRLLGILERHQVSFEHCPSAIDSLSVVVEAAGLEDKVDTVLEEIRSTLKPDELEFVPQIALIAIVGEGMAHTVGIAAKVFNALRDAKVNVRLINQGASELNIIVGVGPDDYENAIRALYAAFVGGVQA